MFFKNLFFTCLQLESFVPNNHPLRSIKELLAKKGPGKEAKLAYMGHTVMENRHGFIVKAAASQATGKAEREVATGLLATLTGSKRRTVGADKNYDTADFVSARQA